MATKQFTLNTEPHVAEIGDKTLLFLPEILGDEFLDAYQEIQDARQQLGGAGSDMENLQIEQVRELNTAIGVFLARLMLPESAAEFDDMRLPSRVLVELMEWCVELYGGGSRPSGSSTGSVTASPPPGTRGRGASRSRASTSTRGR